MSFVMDSSNTYSIGAYTSHAAAASFYGTFDIIEIGLLSTLKARLS